MSKLPPDLYKTLHVLLLRILPHEYTLLYQRLHMDAHLYHLAHSLPKENSPVAQITALIAHLHDQQTAQGEQNALLYFVQIVMQEPPDTANHRQLAKLAIPLQAEIAEQINWLERANPYRGLLAFEEEHEKLFFGRDRFTADLLERVQTMGFVAVIGASGSGKSSLVRAGLIPQLRRMEGWHIVVMRPSEKPFRALAQAITPADVTGTPRLQQVAWLQSQWREGALSLDDTVLNVLAPTQQTRLLLFVDQFEELFTLGADRATQHRFLDLLLSGQALTVLLTLRADFMGQAMGYRPLADRLQSHDLLLGPMTLAELRQAIVQPPVGRGVQFEAGLVDRILDDVDNEPGNLPLLQFALSQLWQSQTNYTLAHDSYAQMGEVQGSLTQYADGVYAGLTPAEQREARQVFTQLVQPGFGTEDTRKRATLAEIGEARQTLLQKLATARLVVADEADGMMQAEVAHEALITRWGQLRGWMDEDRTFRAWQERLRHSLALWEQTDHDSEALLRGVMLAEAHSWLDNLEYSLPEREKQFVVRSLVQQGREKADKEAKQQAEIDRANQQAEQEHRTSQRIRRFGIGAGLFALLALILAGVIVGQARDIRQTARVNEVFTWTSEASKVWEQQPVKSLLLAWYSSKLMQDVNILTVHTVDSLWTSLNAPLQLGRFDGQLGFVGTVSYSLDGQYVITTGGNPQFIHVREVDTRAHLWTANGRLLAVLEGHTDRVLSAEFGSDGERVVTASADGTARVWDAWGERVTVLEGHGASIRSAKFSPNGEWIVTASDDGTARVWDVTGEQLSILEGHMGRVLSAKFSADGQWIVTASDDGTARVWDVTGEQLSILEGHTDRVLSAEFSADGQWVVTASADETAMVWNVMGERLLILEGHTDIVWSAEFSSDAERIVTASDDGTARVWDVRGENVVVLDEHTDRVLSVAISPDGKQIVTGSADGTARVWNIERGSVTVLDGHIGWVLSVSFSMNGNRVVTGSSDGMARVWNANGGDIAVLKGHRDWVLLAKFSPDGEHIVTGSSDGTVRVWNIAGGSDVVLEEYTDRVLSVELSTYGKRIVTASDDGIVKVWNMEGELITTLEGHTDRVLSVKISSDGKRIVTGGYDGIARLWNATGEQLSVLKGHTDWVQSVAFSPDGEWIVTGSADGTAIVWNMSGEIVVVLDEHTAFIRSVKFSPDGEWIVTGSADGTARIWDRDGESVAILDGHTGSVLSVEFSPNGDRVVTGSEIGMVRVWNTEGELIATLEGHTDRVLSAEFSPDGEWIVTASADGTARLWWAWSSTEEMLVEAERRLRLLYTHEACMRDLGVIEACDYLFP